MARCMTRYEMRSQDFWDGHLRKALCLAHEDCRAAGVMIQPGGRKVKLQSKNPEISGLNDNFSKHLRKRDAADGTDLLRHWQAGLIHGPMAGFVHPYPCPPCAPPPGGGSPPVAQGAAEPAAMAADPAETAEPAASLVAETAEPTEPPPGAPAAASAAAAVGAVSAPVSAPASDAATNKPPPVARAEPSTARPRKRPATGSATRPATRARGGSST